MAVPFALGSSTVNGPSNASTADNHITHRTNSSLSLSANNGSSSPFDATSTNPKFNKAGPVSNANSNANSTNNVKTASTLPDSSSTAASSTSPAGNGVTRQGVCKFFNSQKGFGFVLDHKPEELGGQEGEPLLSVSTFV